MKQNGRKFQRSLNSAIMIFLISFSIIFAGVAIVSGILAIVGIGNKNSERKNIEDSYRENIRELEEQLYESQEELESLNDRIYELESFYYEEDVRKTTEIEHEKNRFKKSKL